jgi:hypothetical protein
MPMDPADPTQRDLWTGEAYQLFMGFAPLDAETFDRVIAAVVEHANLHTPKRGGTRGYVTRLPNGKRAVCRIDGGREANSTSYVTFYIPGEALTLTDRRVRQWYLRRTDSPDEFIDGWFRALDDWLAAIAQRVHEVEPVRAGRIGWEATIEPLDFTAKPRRAHGRAQLVERDGRLDYLPASRNT